MKWTVCVALGLCLLLTAGITFSAEGRARVEFISGTVFLYSSAEGASRPAAMGDELGREDGLILEDGANASVFFDDGSQMDLSGACHVRLRLVEEYARTVELHYGTISRLRVSGIATGVFTPSEVYAVIQNGDLFMRAEMMSEPQRTTIWLREGQPGVCGHASRSQTLEVGKPVVFLTAYRRPPLVSDATAEGGGLAPPPFVPHIPPSMIDVPEASYTGRRAR